MILSLFAREVKHQNPVVNQALTNQYIDWTSLQPLQQEAVLCTPGTINIR